MALGSTKGKAVDSRYSRWLLSGIYTVDRARKGGVYGVVD